MIGVCNIMSPRDFLLIQIWARRWSKRFTNTIHPMEVYAGSLKWPLEELHFGFVSLLH